MENKKFESRNPDFTGNGVGVWVNEDKDGKKYLTIKLAGHNAVTAFKNEPKPKPKGDLI